MNETTTNPATASGTPRPASIQVWVCPNCAGWAGSSAMGDLAGQVNRRNSMQNSATEEPGNWGKSTGTRDICQACRQQGNGDHHRVLTVYVLMDVLEITLENQVEDAYKREEKGSGVSIPRPR